MVLLKLKGVEIDQPTGIFIDNEFVETNEVLDTKNPYNDELICSPSIANEKYVNQAVNSSREAFKSWRFSTVDERIQLLSKLADLIERDSEILSYIESLDAGKPLSQSKGEVQAVIAIYRYYSGWVDKLEGSTIEIGDKLAYLLREPIGVCGAIIPWNFPLLIAAGWKLAPCIATGNTMVIKVSELTPLSMLYFCKLIKEAGFPPGVVNVINGLGSCTGSLLAAHKDVDKISFTGSTSVGKLIMQAASTNLKKMTLECGGKSAMIVLEDADVQKAALNAFQGGMSNMGQICSAITRVYVQKGVYNLFLEELKSLVSNITVGDPFDDKFQGPQISKLQKDKIDSYIRSGIDEGATLVIGGEISPTNFVNATVFADVKDDMKIVKEEIFGPVLVVASIEDENEGIKLANNTDYGLLASVFTSNITKAHKVAKRLEAGQVFINSANNIDHRVPFGGYKKSGFGKELGKEALDGYTQIKAIHVDLTE